MRYAINKCIYKKRILPKPFMKFKDNILTELNAEFEVFTGYTKDEMIGKSSEEVDEILKIDSQVHLKNIKNEFTGYLFTKNFEPREVSIKYSSDELCQNVTYTIKENNSSKADCFPFFNSILDDDTASIAIYDYKDDIILKFNNNYSNYFVKSDDIAGDFVGKKAYDILKENMLNEYKEINSFDYIDKPFHLNEVRYKLNDNCFYYFDNSFIPIRIKGEVKYIVHRLVDVTERVLRRKQVEQQNKELEIVLDNITDELIIFNKDGQYLNLNKAARESEMFDYIKAKDVSGFYKQAETYEMDGTKISFENLPLNQVKEGQVVNKRIIRKNKKNNKIRYCDLRGNPIYDDEGNFVAGILIMRNIDDRIKKEENIYIKSQYESLYKVVENLNLGYTAVSYPNFKIKYLNKKSFGYLNNVLGVESLSAAIGKDMFKIFNYSMEETNEIKKNIKNAIKYEKGTYTSIKKLDVLGEEMFKKVVYQPIYNLNKKVDQIIAVSFDITEEIESKIELEQALMVQDEIYANIAHELKTPLNVIYSANQVQEFYLRNFSAEEIKDKLINYNKSVNQNCLRLIKLINNIVDMSKIKTGHLRIELVNENIVDIVKSIVLSVSEYIKSEGLKIIFDTNIYEKIIACDPNIIERILLNLISNAIKFTNSNGEITVSILDADDKVAIIVKDTGIGIEKKNLENIFTRFYQVDKSLSRNAEGSGIGLSLVKSFVDLHGGNISVKSEIGKGTEFMVELSNIKIKSKTKKQYDICKSKIEILDVEFSDIYSI